MMHVAAPTKKQLSYLMDLRKRTGSTKTHTPLTRFQASNEIAILKRKSTSKRPRKKSAASALASNTTKRIDSGLDGDWSRVEPFAHKIKGGYSQARRDGKNHSGNRKPTIKQMAYLMDLRQRTGSTKTFEPDTRLEAQDEIVILRRRLEGH